MRMNEKTFLKIENFFPVANYYHYCCASLRSLRSRAAPAPAALALSGAPRPCLGARRSASRPRTLKLAGVARTYALARTLHLCSQIHRASANPTIKYLDTSHITLKQCLNLNISHLSRCVSPMLIACGGDERCALILILIDTDTDTHIQRAHPSNPSLPPCASQYLRLMRSPNRKYSPRSASGRMKGDRASPRLRVCTSALLLLPLSWVV